jgi:hypothetical protein
MHSPNTDAWPTFAHVCDCRVPFALLANRPKVATGLTRANVARLPAPRPCGSFPATPPPAVVPAIVRTLGTLLPAI